MKTLNRHVSRVPGQAVALHQARPQFVLPPVLTLAGWVLGLGVMPAAMAAPEPAGHAGPHVTSPAPARSKPRLSIEGVTVLDAEALTRHWQAAFDRPADAPTLDAIVRGVEDQVRAAGRPFARVYVPKPVAGPGLAPQVVRIVVIEGHYGRVEFTGDAAERARAWFEELQTGRPIGPELERQVQLVSQLPGVSATASLGPGEAVGEGAIGVVVQQARRWEGEIGVDNHGNRFSGQHRVVAAGHGNGLLTFGDRLSLSGSVNDGRGWQGALSYRIPFGKRGTQLSFSGGRHHYELGGEFKPLQAQGQVDSAGAQFVVPLVTGTKGRVAWQFGADGRRIVSRHDAVAMRDRRQSFSVTTGLQTVVYPTPGVVMWGGVSAEAGNLRLLDADARAFDAASARVAGEYLVLSSDVSLLSGWDRWSLLVRASGQMTDGNLDASRKFVLGGPRSVGARPQGGAAGGQGALLQSELRYRVGTVEPFAFLDAGRVQFNHTLWPGAGAKRTGRGLAGAGVGVRWQMGGWQAEGMAGWRLAPEGKRQSTSDPSGKVPQLWLSISYAL